MSNPGQGGGAGSMVSTLLMFGAIILIMYFLMIRPQQKRQKEHHRMLTELKKGDKVITNGGMHGTITDIAEKTIQLKTDSGAIEQVSAEDLPAGKAGVKLTDIAIGDYIIAMGYRNGNHVLNAKRILITQPTPVPQIKIIYGKVKSISKKEIMVNENDKAAVATTTKLSNKKTKAEDTVIVVGTTIKDIFTARTIFLVESTVPSPTPKI